MVKQMGVVGGYAVSEQETSKRGVGLHALRATNVYMLSYDANLGAKACSVMHKTIERGWRHERYNWQEL